MHKYGLIEWQLKLLFPDIKFYFKHRRNWFYVITSYWFNDGMDEDLLKFAMGKVNYRFINSWQHKKGVLYSLSSNLLNYIVEPEIFLFKKMKEFIPLTEFIGMI